MSTENITSMEIEQSQSSTNSFHTLPPTTEPVTHQHPSEIPPTTEPVINQHPSEIPPTTQPVTHQHPSEIPPTTEPVINQQPIEIPPTQPVINQHPTYIPPTTEFVDDPSLIGNYITKDIPELWRSMVKEGEKFAVILTTGSMCPVHLMHVRMMLYAKQRLQQEGYTVIGGLISPSHDDYVSGKMQSKGYNAYKPEDRLKLLDLILHEDIPEYPSWNNPQWLWGWRWEIDAEGFNDFPQVYRKAQELINQRCGRKVDLFYVCGADHSQYVWIRNTIVMKRPGYPIDNRRNWIIVEKDIEDLSSTKVRSLVLSIQATGSETKEKELEVMVGRKAKDYLLSLELIKNKHSYY